MRTIADINDKIEAGKAVVWTVEELKAKVAELGITQAAKAVDVITTGTFEPMESSGAILNLGHTDPPIKIRQCWLDGVAAYSGFGAVDLYLGASQAPDRKQPAELMEGEDIQMQGGGHVIEDLIAGKSVHLRALNQFYLFNPRNLYQNFIVGVNGGDHLLYTYLGPLQPRLGNAIYSNPGALSPLLNDPTLRLIGVGTRIFLGGGVGYVTWEGTQHFPLQKRLPNDTPIGPAATLALIGDAKQMESRWVRGCYFKQYGPSLMLGVGIPLPVIDEEVVRRCAVTDEDLVAPIIDFSIPRRVRPTFGLVSYAQLKSGKIKVETTKVRSAPLASMALARQVALELKQWIELGTFTLTEPVAAIACDRTFVPQDAWGTQIRLD